MGRIRLEARSWISDALGFKGKGHLITEKEISKGTTIGVLLRSFAGEHQAFRELAYDADSDKLSGQISIVLNGKFLDTKNGQNTVLKDDDKLILFPVISGG